MSQQNKANFMNTGIFVIGELIGYKAQAWKNDPSRFNHRIGIKQSSVDSWGQESASVLELDIPMSLVEQIKAQAETLKGKLVSIKIKPLAKQGGRNGAFLTYLIVDGITSADLKSKNLVAA